MSRTRLPKGKGWFIWVINETMDGDPVKIAKFAKDNGFGHLLFHIHNGYQNEMQCPGGADLRPYVQEAHKLGIECWGWGAVYGTSWNAGADRVIESFRKHTELIGYIIDAEAGFKGFFNEATQLMRKLRANLPDTPMGLSSYRYPKYHQTLPWKEFRSQIDFDMPQVYWEQDKRDDAGYLQLEASYKEFQSMSPKLPYIPTAPAYKINDWSATPKQIESFIRKAKELKLYGINYWVWYQSQKNLPATFETIRIDKVFSVGEIIPPEPQPEPPTNDVILPTLTVTSSVRVRTQPNTNYLAKEIRMRKPGEIIHVEEIKINSMTNIWVRDNEGWSAVFYAGWQYME